MIKSVQKNSKFRTVFSLQTWFKTCLGKGSKFSLKVGALLEQLQENRQVLRRSPRILLRKAEEMMQLLAFLQDETLLGSGWGEAGGSLENIYFGTFGYIWNLVFCWLLCIYMYIYLIMFNMSFWKPHFDVITLITSPKKNQIGRLYRPNTEAIFEISEDRSWDEPLPSAGGAVLIWTHSLWIGLGENLLV